MANVKYRKVQVDMTVAIDQSSVAGDWPNEVILDTLQSALAEAELFDGDYEGGMDWMVTKMVEM